MASVWRAYDETLARVVAVKVLHEHLADDDAFRQRFRREAVSAAKLSHPNIVGLYDTGWSDDEVWLVMELIDGSTLRDTLARDGPIDPAETAAIGEKVARALDYAHKHGVIHRDIKPGNILLGEDDTVKVADFGIAKLEDWDEVTRPGTMLGTAAYVSPEQLRGLPLNGAADQYALGCVLFEALTGRQPFEGDSAVATATLRLESDPLHPQEIRPEIPMSLADVVTRALAREPEERFPTTADLAEALGAFAHGERSSAALASTAARSAPDRHAPLHAPGPTDEAALGAETEWQHLAASTWTGAAASGDGSSRRATRTNDTDAEERSSTRLPSPRSDVRWLAVGLGLVLLAAGLLGLLAAEFVDSEGLFPSASPSEEAERQQQQEEAQAASSKVLAPAAVELFDPEGGTSEDAAGLTDLFDGNADTGWESTGYNTPAFGNLKSGVGFWVDLGEPHRLEQVALRSSTPGVAVQLRTAEEPAPTPGGWEPVASGTATSGLTEFQLDEVETRYLLVWVTGQLQPNGAGRYGAAFSELGIVGFPP